MVYLYHALQAEWLKLRKAKMIWVTALLFTIAPLMAGFFMFALKDLSLAKNSGLLGAKAHIAGEATWKAYLQLHAQMIAIGGILVFGFVTSWIFGREYADNTINNLLALPYSRAISVGAKLITALVANLLLSLYIISLGLILGWLIGIPEGSFAIVFEGLVTIGVVTLFTILLTSPTAFFASYGRGYLAAIGFILSVLILSQVLTAAGFGHYFPWAIPALQSGMLEDNPAFTIGQSLIIFTTCLFGVISTIAWWVYANQ